jgi:hypothetical protein
MGERTEHAQGLLWASEGIDLDREREAIVRWFAHLPEPIHRGRLERFARRGLAFWDQDSLDRFKDAQEEIEAGRLRPSAALGKAFRGAME